MVSIWTGKAKFHRPIKCAYSPGGEQGFGPQPRAGDPQAERFTSTAVDELTRVDIACRHLGTMGACKEPIEGAVAERLPFGCPTTAAPLIDPGTRFGYDGSDIEYMYRKKFFLTLFCMRNRGDMRSTIQTKFLGEVKSGT